MVQGGAIGAGVVGPVFYGWVFDTKESYDLAILASVVVMVAGLPLTYMLRKPQEMAKSLA
jgi:cyanate permease